MEIEKIEDTVNWEHFWAIGRASSHSFNRRTWKYASQRNQDISDELYCFPSDCEYYTLTLGCRHCACTLVGTAAVTTSGVKIKGYARGGRLSFCPGPPSQPPSQPIDEVERLYAYMRLQRKNWLVEKQRMMREAAKSDTELRQLEDRIKKLQAEAKAAQEQAVQAREASRTATSRATEAMRVEMSALEDARRNAEARSRSAQAKVATSRDEADRRSAGLQAVGRPDARPPSEARRC